MPQSSSPWSLINTWHSAFLHNALYTSSRICWGQEWSIVSTGRILRDGVNDKDPSLSKLIVWLKASSPNLHAKTSPPLTLSLLYILQLHPSGLGLMDAHTWAVPDFVLTMSQAIWYAEKGFSFSKTEPTHHLPVTLCEFFRLQKNVTSSFLCTFYRLLPYVALVGTHTKCLWRAKITTELTFHR